MDAAKKKFGGAMGVSAMLHAGLALIAIILMSVHSGRVASQPPPVALHVTYTPLSGLAGGGGGHPDPAPPRPLEVPRHQEPPPLVPATVTLVNPPSLPVLNAPVETDNARLLQFSGAAITQLAAPGGNGRGPGAGPGDGSGLSNGSGGNVGGGPMRPGGDVLPPTLVRSVDPQFTAEAMQARIQGTVELEVVVQANGTVGTVRVVRSLDAIHGLDIEASRAAKQWIFRPGTRAGQPVDVLVRLILEFTIH
jgi:TonB family protein